MIVCDCDNKTCMVHRRDKCPGTDSLREYLKTLLEEHEEVTLQQWQTTDRSKMVTQTLNVHEFIDLLVGAIDNLTSHSYTSDEGRRKFQKIGDFAEKYTFVVLDEIQSFT